MMMHGLANPKNIQIRFTMSSVTREFLNELASTTKSNARTLSVMLLPTFFLTCVVGLRAKVSDPLTADVGK
jgi:hypothetical protein